MDDHKTFTREAIILAKQAVNNGNQPFGALLVHNDEVLLIAENTVTTDRDMTAHAELNLIQKAAKQLDKTILAEATLYSSTEPCAMCAGAVCWAGIGRVVYGCSNDRLMKVAGKSLDVPCCVVFSKSSHPIEIIGPILEEEAVKVHSEFWQ